MKRWLSLQALSDNQRFTLEATYLTLTSNLVLAVVQEASPYARSLMPSPLGDRILLASTFSPKDAVSGVCSPLPGV